MKVSDLIKVLQSFPAEMPVMTPGFDESGLDDLDTVEQIKVVQVNDGSGHSGKFEDVARLRATETRSGEPIEVVVLNF